MVRYRSQERAETAKKVVAENNLVFVTLQNKFDGAENIAPAEHLLFDGVHPTAVGYELIKKEWIKAFKLL